MSLRYAPSTTELSALDRGFAVTRSYVAAERLAGVDAEHPDTCVRRDPDGTWHIQAGTLVLVTVTMFTPTERAQSRSWTGCGLVWSRRSGDRAPAASSNL